MEDDFELARALDIKHFWFSVFITIIFFMLVVGTSLWGT
jgi:hypothetical protein